MNRQDPTRRWVVIAIVVICAITAATPRLFQAPTDSAATPEFAPGEPGLMAAIDPETGELAIGADAMRLRNNKAVDRELRANLSRSDAGLVEVVYPEGHVGVHLQGRFMSTSVVRLNEAGGAETLCTDDAAEAEAFLAGAAPTKPEVDSNGWEVR